MPAASTDLTPMGEIVRRADPDRFFTTLFAPPDKREALWTLYAFNNELARAWEATSEPMMALIRLQWWREVVEGQRKGHEVATPLTALLEAGVLDRGELLSVVEAREVTAFATVAAWREWLLAGPGMLAAAAGRVLGVPDSPGLAELGAGYGAAGVLRNTPVLARRGLCLLPEDVLATHGLTPDAVTGGADKAALRAVFAALASEGRALLGRPARRGRVLAAALPAVLARRDLRSPGQSPVRTFADRLALTTAGLLSRA
jgi:phytoene synthase